MIRAFFKNHDGMGFSVVPMVVLTILSLVMMTCGPFKKADDDKDDKTDDPPPTVEPDAKGTVDETVETLLTVTSGEIAGTTMTVPAGTLATGVELSVILRHP